MVTEWSMESCRNKHFHCQCCVFAGRLALHLVCVRLNIVIVQICVSLVTTLSVSLSYVTGDTSACAAGR